MAILSLLRIDSNAETQRHKFVYAKLELDLRVATSKLNSRLKASVGLSPTAREKVKREAGAEFGRVSAEVNYGKLVEDELHKNNKKLIDQKFPLKGR